MSSRRLALVVLLSVLALPAGTQSASAATQQPDFWVTNGPIRASLLVGSTLYIGGDFTYEGP